jgi:hypothetical protein
LHVEVDIFSGRPNPSWELSAQEAQELLERVQRLPRSAAVGSVKQDLGYRGLIVTADKNEAGGFDRLLVSDGIVLASAANRPQQQFTDDGRALERWLLKIAKGQIEDGLYTYILSQVEHD